ncbi:MAG: cytochrome c [Verrucomicrobiota bacterium]
MHTITVSVLLIALLGGCAKESPKKPEADAEPPPRPQELDQSTQSGKQLFARHCQSCHGDKGQGVAGIFPPLTGSPRLTDPALFVQGLIYGYPKPPADQPSPWMGQMPLFAQLGDEQLAAVANYTRMEWGNATDEISVETVAEIRDANGN